MVLRKTTVDKSVRNFPRSEKKKRLKQKKTKQNKIFHKTIKNSFKMWQQADLGYLDE